MCHFSSTFSNENCLSGEHRNSTIVRAPQKHQENNEYVHLYNVERDR